MYACVRVFHEGVTVKVRILIFVCKRKADKINKRNMVKVRSK